MHINFREKFELKYLYQCLFSVNELIKVYSVTLFLLFSIIYFVLQNPYPRDANETKDCPRGICPYIKFTLTGGDPTDADCRYRLQSPDPMAVQSEVQPIVQPDFQPQPGYIPMVQPGVQPDDQPEVIVLTHL